MLQRLFILRGNGSSKKRGQVRPDDVNLIPQKGPNCGFELNVQHGRGIIWGYLEQFGEKVENDAEWLIFGVGIGSTFCPSQRQLGVRLSGFQEQAALADPGLTNYRNNAATAFLEIVKDLIELFMFAGAADQRGIQIRDPSYWGRLSKLAQQSRGGHRRIESFCNDWIGNFQLESMPCEPSSRLTKQSLVGLRR